MEFRSDLTNQKQLFDVDYKEKARIHKTIIKNTPRLNALRIIKKILLYGSIAASFGFLFINLFVRGIGEVNVNGVLKKDYFSIVANTSIILIVGLFLAVIIHFLLGNLSSKDISERTDECILCSDGRVVYTFRTRYETGINDRVCLVINSDGINHIDYCNNLKKLQIVGDFLCGVINNYDGTVPSDLLLNPIKEIVIFDYFNPSIYNYLFIKENEDHGKREI